MTRAHNSSGMDTTTVDIPVLDGVGADAFAADNERSTGSSGGRLRPRETVKRLLELRSGLRLLWSAAPTWTLANGVVLLFQGLLPLAGLLVLKRLIDSMTAAASMSEPILRQPLLYVAILGALALLNAALQASSILIDEIRNQKLTDHVQDLIHAKSVQLDLAFFETSEYQDQLHRAQQEGPSRPTSLATGLAALVQNAIGLLAVTGLLLAFNPWIVGVVALLSLPGLAIKLKSSEDFYRWQLERTSTERRARFVDWMLTFVQFAREVRLFGLGQHLRNRHKTLRQELLSERLALARKRAFALLGTQAGGTVALIGGLILVVFQMARGTISLGDLVMYYGALQRALSATQQLLGSLASLYEDSLFLSNLRGFLELEPRVRDPETPRPVPHPMTRGILFEDVSFSYPGAGEPVLENIHLEIRPGETIALVGENGAGKSTLVKLLCRLYDPDSGRVSWDGVDLRDLRVADLRRQITVAFQDFARFPVTVRENIRFGDLDRGDKKSLILEAARSAGAEQLVADLPRGYDTELGTWFEGGQELSAGQWQKLALARAFFRDAQLIVFDEPTSDLDALAEAELFERFRQLTRGRTTFLISHRFSSVRMADRIFVLAKGRIIEGGTHEELVRLRGFYARMFEAQARMYR